MRAFAMMPATGHRPNSPPPKKKRNAEPRQNSKYRQSVIDPLVNPGSPPHRHQARPKADPTRTHHCMVTLAQSSPGRRSTCPLQNTTTVMLGRELFPYRGGAVADLFNRLLKFFPRYLQMLGPTLNLLWFMHVDLRAIVLGLAFQALHFVLLMKSKPADQNQASLFPRRF